MAFTISALGSPVEHDTAQGQFNKTVAIDSTHWLQLYQGSAGDGHSQVFTIDGSGNVSEVGTGLEFDTADQLGVDAALMDANHVIVTWASNLSDGFVQILTVNLSTWDVTAEGTALEYDTDNGVAPLVRKIDSTHAIVVYQGTDADGFARILDVNTSTWAVTDNAAASLEFDTGDYTLGAIANINSDATRWLITYRGVSADGFARVLTVNTSDWTIAATSVLEFDTSNGSYNSLAQLDANHFLNTYSGGGSSTGKAIVLTVNLSTWAITAGTSAEFDAGASIYTSTLLLTESSTHYYATVAYSDSAFDGWIKVLTINKVSWGIVVDSASLEFDAADATHISSAKVSDSRIIVFWAGVGADGFVQAFSINTPPTIALNTPADASSDSDTTPTLDFTGTDPAGDSITYNVQVDTVNTFDSVGASGVIARDASTDGGSVTASSLTYSHTCTGSNRALFVGVKASTDVVTGVTYNGVAMTQVNKNTAGSSTGVSYVYMLVAPATGANDIVISASGSTDLFSMSSSYTGVLQTNSANATAKTQPTGIGSGSWTGCDVVTTTDNCWVLMWSIKTFTEVPSAQNGWSTLRSAASRCIIDHNTVEALPGTKSPVVAHTGGSQNYAHISVAFAPAVATPLINAVSSSDPGFVNPDTGGDTDPFNSGENIQYTVQSALSTTTYYWRVRGIDPSGSGVYGAWSSTRSFTVTGGGVSLKRYSLTTLGAG